MGSNDDSNAINTQAGAISVWVRSRAVAFTYVIVSLVLSLAALSFWAVDSPFDSWRQERVLLLAIIIGGMMIVENADLEIEGQRQTHHLTFNEVLLVIAVVYLSPMDFVLVRVGVGTAWLLRRHTSTIKLIFNAALFAMEATFLSFLVRLVLTEIPSDALDWLWVMTSVLIMTLASTLAVSAAISLRERHRSWALLVRSQGFAVVVGTTTGVLVASSGVLSTSLLFFAVPTLLGVTWLLRAYGDLTQGHDELESCYEFSREIATMPFLDDVIDETLQQARKMLRGESARLIVLEAPDGSPPTEYLFDGETRPRSLPLRDYLAWIELDIADSAVERRSDQLEGTARLALESRGIDVALLSAIQGRGLSALLVVTDRGGLQGVGFTARDLDLFGHITSTAAAQLSVGYLLRELEESTLKDSLTGLPNRRRFERELEALVSNGQEHAVLVVDLVGLENVNDTLGHESGDYVVQELGRRLTQIAGPDWVVARFPSGEFAVGLPGVGAAGQAMLSVEKLQTAFSQALELDGTSLEVASQIGIAFFPEHTQDLKTLIRRADIAAEAAATSPTSATIYSAEIDDRSPRRLAMARELRVAIEQGFLEVHYQPKANLSTGEIVGVEALCRWTHPSLGAVSPDEFIEVAEKNHLIAPLTDLVLTCSLDAQARWTSDGLHCPVAVNLSPLVLLDQTFADRLVHELEVRGLDTEMLTLELTETTVLREEQRSTAALQGLDNLGIRLSIDDFGTGYSSLAYLRGLPVSELKIDRSFIAEAMDDSHSETIVASTIDLARGLGLSVVAEGVEDRSTWEWLERLGCNHVQGFYLAKPMPEADFLVWVEQYSALRKTESQVSGPRSGSEGRTSGPSNRIKTEG